MTEGVHEAASRGFGAVAGEYERSRPDYPAEAIDRLVQELEIVPRCILLDAGAGTGKLTRMLAPSGAEIHALEPVESMWRGFRSVLPQVPLVAGTAEALPFADRSFDGVVAGQAFHWFDGDRALAEIHRVLRPRGRLGVLWNVRDQTVPWVRALSDIIEPHEGNAPREYQKTWQGAFARTGLFGTLHQRRFRHAQTLTPEGLVERVRSMSFIAVLPEAEREGVYGQVRDLIEEDPDLRGKAEFALPYMTELYWCARA